MKKGKPIKASDVGRELLYPLTESAIVYAMVFYWFLFWLAQKAGFFGLALLIVTLPAYFRYLIYLLEARAHGRAAPVPSIEMFTPWDNLWTLTPLIHLAVAIWAGIWLARYDSLLATAISTLALLFILPASLAVLAVSHSPAASLNPLFMMRMMRACGTPYYAVPVVLLLLSTAFAVMYLAGVPLILIGLCASYEIVLLFTITGAVVHARNIAALVEIGEPLEATDEELARDLENQRRKVANHAYAFISRGNREGGFEHIHEWLENETALGDAWQWFLEEMLNWDNKDPALFFAQEYLDQLLEWRSEKEAIKLITRCLYHNERWRPLAESRPYVNEMLTVHGRNDLLKQLQQ